MTWRDYLIMLLHIAAEIEHGLMVEYLYAAYSLGGDDAAEREKLVQGWRNSIITVAREEMGHLLTVQNLLCLIGGPISFEREDYPWSTPFYPFPFKLQPLSLESLACFVYAEMPPDMPNPDDRKVRDEVTALINLGDSHQVAEIYDRIIELVGDRQRIPDWTFNADTYSQQASWDDWGRGYQPGPFKPHATPTDEPPPYERKSRVIVMRMATRTEALAALKEVAGQGEAPHHLDGKKMEPSHFDRFAEIFKQLRKILEETPDWNPARLVPDNPIASDPPHNVTGLTCITAEPSKSWASLFNIRYRMMLTLLTHSFRVPREATEESARRGPIMARVFGEMYNLKTLAGILVRLPLTHPKDERRAGPPFQMPYTLTPPFPEVNFWLMQLDLIQAADALIADLLHPERNNLADAPADGGNYLRALRDLDRGAKEWIEKVIEGLVPTGRHR